MVFSHFAERRLRRGTKPGVGVAEIAEGKRRQGLRQPPRQGIAADPQFGHRRQLAQLGREPTGQTVVTQIESGDPADGVGPCPVPVVEYESTEPAGGVVPACASRGIVQRLKRGDVVLVAE